MGSSVHSWSETGYNLINDKYNHVLYTSFFEYENSQTQKQDTDVPE